MANKRTKTGTKPNSKQPLLSILIPVYNEKSTILDILERTATLPIERYEILVVDDASQDGSTAIIDTFVKKFKKPNVAISVHTHPKNRGKGAGIQTGLQHAKGSYFVIQDADLEYDPKDIPKLLEAALQEDRPVVYGSRFLGKIKNMAAANYHANRFYNFLLRRLYKTNVTDMHTCYKMLKTDLLKEFNITSNGFNYAPEVISNILKRGIPIYEVPIAFNGRTKQEGKKIGYKDGIECTYALLKYRFTK